jgi:hypothetical protein
VSIKLTSEEIWHNCPTLVDRLNESQPDSPADAVEPAIVKELDAFFRQKLKAVGAALINGMQVQK